MTAYVVVDIHLNDPVGYEENRKSASPTPALYGGKYIARGGRTEILEGDWAPGRLVILEFENSEQAKKWRISTEYNLPRQLRHKTATSNRVVIDGA